MSILAQAAHALDFSQPVAVMLVAALHHILDTDDPYALTGQLRAAVASGSHLVVSHPAADIQTEAVAEVARRYSTQLPVGQTRRTRDEVARFFGDWDILEPSVTQTVQWRPDSGPHSTTPSVPMWAGVARKP